MPFERILVAIDGSDCSDRAFGKALELAVLTNATLTALAIEGPLPALRGDAWRGGRGEAGEGSVLQRSSRAGS